MAKRSRRRGRTVTLYRPPLGSYDPGLDAQERAAERGYDYTTKDIARGRERALSDFITAQGDIQRQKGDVQREYGENLTDMLTSRKRGQQDYTSNLQTINRNFQRLGNVQAQRGRQAGLGGGFARQAARKRAANKAIERAPVDLNFQRFMADSRLGQKRLGEARVRSIDELDRSAGRLAEDYRRGGEDFDVTGYRAGRELENLRLDLADTRESQRQQTQGGGLPTYRVPLTRKQRMTRALRSTRIGGKPVTYRQWKRGDLASALLGSDWRKRTGYTGGI